MSDQPKWKLVGNLGDASPLDHGGFFVYVDETGVYDPQVEVLEVDDEDGYAHDSAACRWTVYRFDIPRCTYVEGVLSDNRFHPDHPAWFADSVDSICTSGMSPDEFRADLCCVDVIRRASAYREIMEYHGVANFDETPLVFTDKAEIEDRYDQTSPRFLVRLLDSHGNYGTYDEFEATHYQAMRRVAEHMKSWTGMQTPMPCGFWIVPLPAERDLSGDYPCPTCHKPLGSFGWTRHTLTEV